MQSGSRRNLMEQTGCCGADAALSELVNAEAEQRLTDLLVVTGRISALLAASDSADPEVRLSRVRDAVQRDLAGLLHRELDSWERLHALTAPGRAQEAHHRRAAFATELRAATGET